MWRDAILLLGRESDPQVKLERSGDFRIDKLADGFAGDAPDELAGEIAKGHGVIEVRRARLPPWLHVRERRGTAVPVEEIAAGYSGFLVEAHKARSMCKDVANRDCRLFSGRELWPIACNRRVIVDQSDRKSTRLNSSHLGISYA